MSTQTELERGHKATMLLENEIYRECVGKLRESIVEAWANSPIRDIDGQHELKLMLKLLDDLQTNIKTIADTGKLAQLQIERESAIKRVARRIGM